MSQAISFHLKYCYSISPPYPHSHCYQICLFHTTVTYSNTQEPAILCKWVKQARCLHIKHKITHFYKEIHSHFLEQYDLLSLSLSFTLPILIDIGTENHFYTTTWKQYRQSNKWQLTPGLHKREKTGSRGDKLHHAGPFKGDNAQL